jgi:threonine dehydratase
MPSLETLDSAAELVHRYLPPTPQYVWPLLAEQAGCELWVKHENHTPIGAFKVRGGLVYMTDLKAAQPDCPGVITATRGNHGQSIGYACRALGLKATILVPHGNSVEKNAAMRALGVELIEHGHDFQAAREEADRLAAQRGLHFLGPYNDLLVRGVASYPLELLRAAPDLDRVYVPIGMGSGICATIAARDALGSRTEVVGVVAENAPAYALSFQSAAPINTNTADTIADGLGCRTPDPEAVAVILNGATDVVTVSEVEIREAMRLYFSSTHNVAEGAGAAALGAVLKDKESVRGKKVGVMLSGGNVDAKVFREVLLGL